MGLSVDAVPLAVVWRVDWRRIRPPFIKYVILPGESHGQRNLAGYSPWGLKESDRTEATEL